MLALFPQILFLAPFAALFIRLTLAILFAYAAWRHVGKRELSLGMWGALEMAIAITLFAGIWTQGIALLGVAFTIATLLAPKLRSYPLSTLLLALVMLLSLVVTGAGAFAFDLPL